MDRQARLREAGANSGRLYHFFPGKQGVLVTELRPPENAVFDGTVRIRVLAGPNVDLTRLELLDRPND